MNAYTQASIGARVVPLLALVASAAAVGCSGSVTTSNAQAIGAAGGSVSIEQGPARGASVTIPAGALASTVTITIREGVPATNLPSGMRSAGPVIVLGPEGQTFNTPVTVTIPTTSAARAMYTRPLGGAEWTAVPGAEFDATRSVIIARVAHFSEFVPGVDTCASNADCPVGTACLAGICAMIPTPVDASLPDPMDASIPTPVDASPSMCRPGHADCNGDVTDGCEVDLRSNPSHCGACGHSCTPGTACRDGACIGDPMCVPSMEVCNGRDDDCDGVVDDNLGSVTCGVGACARTLPNCRGGVPLTCTPGMPSAETCNGIDDDCDGTVDEGLMCPPPDPTDAGLPMCRGGRADCDGNPINGCEVDLLSSTFNCGACGAVCAMGSACRDGVCIADPACMPSTEVCNGRDDDCDGAVDEGLMCPPPDPTDAGFPMCRPGYADCNGDVTDGCEIDLRSSTFNCGACGHSCTPGTACRDGVCAGGTMCMPRAETCNGVDDDCDGLVDEGACGTMCPPGFADCDANPMNGCEMDLRSSPSNCGACGVSCAPGRMCADGVCL